PCIKKSPLYFKGVAVTVWASGEALRLHAEVVEGVVELLDAGLRLAGPAQLFAVGAQRPRLRDLGGGAVGDELLIELLLQGRALLRRGRRGAEGRRRQQGGCRRRRHQGADVHAGILRRRTRPIGGPPGNLTMSPAGIFVTNQCAAAACYNRLQGKSRRQRMGRYPAEARRSPMDGSAHILVVDDDREIRELLSRFLVKHGYRV